MIVTLLPLNIFQQQGLETISSITRLHLILEKTEKGLLYLAQNTKNWQFNEPPVFSRLTLSVFTTEFQPFSATF